MAQSGHGWPAARYHPDPSEHDAALNTFDDNLSYGVFDEDDNLQVPGWAGSNHPVEDFANQSHTSPSDQGFMAHQTYYHNDNAPDGTPAFGNGTFNAHTYGEHGQQQPRPTSYSQQYNSPQSSRHTSQVASNFADGSWHGTTHQPIHNQYSHQSMSFDSPASQSLYPHLQPQPQRPTRAPATGSLASGHFAVNHGSTHNYNSDMNAANLQNFQDQTNQQQSATAASSYQPQLSRAHFNNSPFQNPPASATRSPVYQTQQQFAPPPNLDVGQMNSLSSVSPRPIAQSQVAPPRGPASGTPSAIPSPASYAVAHPASQPGTVNPTRHHNFAIQNQLPATQQSTQTANGQVISTWNLPEVIEFDPISAGGYTVIKGCPNLFVSDAPVGAASDSKILPEKSSHFTAQFNSKDGVLLPNRKERLPGEIKRDWSWLRKQERLYDVEPVAGGDAHAQAQAGVIKANNQAKLHVIEIEKDRLNKEWTTSNGGSALDSLSSMDERKRSGKSVKAESDSSSDDSGMEDAADLDPATLEAQQIMMSPRPTDSLKAVEYDVIKLVWRDARSDQSKSTAHIISEFGQYMETILTNCKKLRIKIKEAKEKKEKSLDSLEAENAAELQVIHGAINAAHKYAEEVVLENMGGNLKLVVGLWNVMKATVVSTKDFNGPLPHTILSFMSKFTTMTTLTVKDTLKIPSYKSKYLKELDSTSHGYLNKIINNAKAPAATTKKVKENTAPNDLKEASNIPKKNPIATAKDFNLTSASKRSVSAETKKAQPIGAAMPEARKVSNENSRTASASPSKRPRDEEVDSRAAKKVAVDGPGSVSGPAKQGTTPVAKSTIVQPRAKPSASILPGRSQRIAKTVVKKPESSKPAPVSTLSSLLADLQRPKSPPKPKEQTAKTNETEAEKTERLRKEARRRLRVMWKPDHELEEIRIFQHDAAEDEGRVSSMMRDARDDWSEGQALKLGRQEGDASQKDDDDDDEDDESELGKPRELTFREWSPAPPVDFSAIDKAQQVQREKNYVTRGGTKAFHTEEQKFMEKYEQTKLMSIYSTLADMPDTPKSPSKLELDKPAVPPKSVHLPATTPNLPEIHLRWEENSRFNTTTGTERMIQRLKFKHPDRALAYDKALASSQSGSGRSRTPFTDKNDFERPRSPHTQPYAFAPSMSLATQRPSPSSRFTFQSQEEWDAEVLRLLSSDKIKFWAEQEPMDPTNMMTKRRHDYGDPELQADVDEFENIAAKFAGNPFPATEPPEHLRSNPEHIKEWQMGYNRDMAAKATLDAKDRAKKLAEEFARNHTASSAAVPAVQPVVSQNPQDTAAAWAAWTAQLSQHQTQSLPAQTQTQSQQLSWDQYAAILQQTQALQAQQAAQPQASQYQPLQPGTQDANSQIAALLATLGGQTSQAQPAASAPQPVSQPLQAQNHAAQWAAYMASIAQGQTQTPSATSYSQQPQQQAYQQSRDWDNDRNARHTGFTEAMYDNGSTDYDARDKRRKENKDNKDNFRGKDYDRKGINRSLIGTKPCTFWAQGKCAKGDQCTFRHDPNDLK